MYDKLKKIVCIGIVAYFVISLIGGAVLSCRLARARNELATIRIELESAQNRQLELESTITDCSVIVSRDKQILSESGASIQFIRAQISAIRESYETMEVLLRNSFSNSSNGSSYNLSGKCGGEVNHERNSD